MAVAVESVNTLRQNVGKLSGHYTETSTGSARIIQLRFHFGILRVDAYAAGYTLSVRLNHGIETFELHQRIECNMAAASHDF